MKAVAIKETMDILKRLSPKNQAYFMTLVRVAETAENGVKHSMINQAKQLTNDNQKSVS